MADNTLTFEGFFNALVNKLSASTGVSASKIAKIINEFEFNIQSEVKPAKKKTPAKPKVKASEEEEEEELEEEEEKPKKAAQSKGKAKPAAKAKGAAEKHTCERIQNGKTEPCGKNAKNEVNDHWYCGTENSGCYKSILGEIKRSEKADKKKPAAEPAKKPATKKVKSASQVETREINGKWVEPEKRIVFDREGSEGVAYGVLAQDNKTVAPLTKKDIAWLEASGIAYTDKPPKKAATKKAETKKTESKGKQQPKKAAASKKKKASSEAEEEEDEIVETDNEEEEEEEEEEEVVEVTDDEEE